MNACALFVSCAKGLEYLLEAECKNLGLIIKSVNPQGVYGEASLETLYRLCLWSRLANRVQLLLFSGEAFEEQSLYRLCHEFHWQTVFSADKTFAIEFHGSSEHIRNTMYGAQVIKDAIVDHFRKFKGQRPNVSRENPDVLLHAHLKNEKLSLSLDLTGFSLHQRGYRLDASKAPLKETLAAAMLIRANWPTMAAKGHSLYDPFCGSGTLVIEAAMMAANIAPGLIRQDQALVHWVNHEARLWEKLREEALQAVKPLSISIQGSDADGSLIAMATANAKRAGVASLVRFHHQALKQCRPPSPQGLLIGNPPYGERLGEFNALVPLYQELGSIAHSHFQGWDLAFLTSNPLLAKAVGLRASKQYTLFNGALECKLYCMHLDASNRLKNNASEASLSGPARMLANRLEKNYKHLQKWAKREHIQAYRVYDADLPEYAFAIDIYNDYAVLQEYAAPKEIETEKAAKRGLDLLQVVPLALGIAANKTIVKERKQQKGLQQYEKIKETKKTIQVEEGRAKFLVNLYDYLDTGLFLDHRPLRLCFAQLPPKTRFLNCFCYTASASVHAALAGAITTNVDLSNTYLQWAEDNFKLNGIDTSRHQFVPYDCLQWLKRARDKFDVIFLDPPSFSNSKRMEGTLDIQRDQVSLIEDAMRLLADGGTLYFSTNLRRFKLAPILLESYQIKDISGDTIDLDFKRNTRIHQCFRIRHKTGL